MQKTHSKNETWQRGFQKEVSTIFLPLILINIFFKCRRQLLMGLPCGLLPCKLCKSFFFVSFFFFSQHFFYLSLFFNNNVFSCWQHQQQQGQLSGFAVRPVLFIVQRIFPTFHGKWFFVLVFPFSWNTRRTILKTKVWKGRDNMFKKCNRSSTSSFKVQEGICLFKP